MADRMEERIGALVDNILADYQGGKDIDRVLRFDQPEKETVIDILNKLQKLVFPGYFKNRSFKVYTIRNDTSMLVEDVLFYLQKQLQIVLRYQENYLEATDEVIRGKAEEIAFSFMEKLPKIREYIETDVQAAFDGDPAAFYKDEIIFSYPGLYAIFVNRVAHELYLLGVPLLPRIMTEYAHSLTGIDINPGASIGKYFFIDHGTGIVVGETTVIGNNVKVYQGVTLGAASTRGGRSLNNKKRHPTIEDNVTIYSGASILGGDTVIGEGAVIGGNCFITCSIPAGAKVNIRSQELVYRYKDEKHASSEPLDKDANWFYII
ncbi:MAG: serine O-acetyltransferase [Lachnospiraceae bacterium]|nr:serine O-acetyltransferase [Lachnospiraceae bacterium]